MEETSDKIMNMELAAVDKDVQHGHAKKAGTAQDRRDMMRLGRQQEMNV